MMFLATPVSKELHNGKLDVRREIPRLKKGLSFVPGLIGF